MAASTWWGIGLLAYAVLTLIIAAFKPSPVWRTGKIQAFVKLFGEKGTVIFLGIIALIFGGIGLGLLL